MRTAQGAEGCLPGLRRVVYRTVYRQVVKTDHRQRLQCCHGFYESRGFCVRESRVGLGSGVGQWKGGSLALALGLNLLSPSRPPLEWGYFSALLGSPPVSSPWPCPQDVDQHFPLHHHFTPFSPAGPMCLPPHLSMSLNSVSALLSALELSFCLWAVSGLSLCLC